LGKERRDVTDSRKVRERERERERREEWQKVRKGAVENSISVYIRMLISTIHLVFKMPTVRHRTSLHCAITYDVHISQLV